MWRMCNAEWSETRCLDFGVQNHSASRSDTKPHYSTHAKGTCSTPNRLRRGRSITLFLFALLGVGSSKPQGRWGFLAGNTGIDYDLEGEVACEPVRGRASPVRSQRLRARRSSGGQSRPGPSTEIDRSTSGWSSSKPCTAPRGTKTPSPLRSSGSWPSRDIVSARSQRQHDRPQAIRHHWGASSPRSSLAASTAVAKAPTLNAFIAKKIPTPLVGARARYAKVP
jgi:hypothetical protein